MKKTLQILMLLLAGTMVLQAQERTKFIEGTVTTVDNEPVANALVGIKNTFVETETGPNGTFRLAVFPGDELVVTAFLMYSKTVSITGFDKPLDVVLEYNAEVLEAVTLEKQKRKATYVEKDFVERDSKKVGYSYEDLGTDFISGADVSMYTVAQKIPFIYVEGDPFFGFQVYNTRMRGAMRSSRVPMLVVVDGVQVEHNILVALDPTLITNITVYRSLAGTVKYGSLGVGGVMAITTLNSGAPASNKKDLPSLLVEGNDYDEGVLPISENMANTTAPYITELSGYSDVKSALTAYNEQRKNPATRNLAYYLDMASFFSKWGDVYGYEVLSDLFQQANNNPRILKAVAFKLEEDGHLLQAAYVMEELLALCPDDIQNYRDVARLYAQTSRYNLAATLYKQMIYNSVPNVNFEPIHAIIFNEFRHLIANHKRKINFKNIPNEFLTVNFSKDVRIVLEYTNPLAEFEVQFVSPNKKYYTWHHTYFESRDFIEQEVAQGFAVKEFIIEDSDYGDWLVNIKSANTNDIAIPTLLKYTLYQNYGLPNETKVVKIVNLATQSDKGTVDAFTY